MRLQSEPSSASTRARISSAALLVKVTASTSSGRACPSPTRYAMRLVMTRVFPEPAPARISSGPLICRTASRCSGLSVSRNCMGLGARNPESLFYRDRLREIARLIHVAAAADRDVVRKELQREHHHDRRQELRRRRHLEHDVSLAVQQRRQLVVPARGKRDDGSAARLHLL